MFHRLNDKGDNSLTEIPGCPEKRSACMLLSELENDTFGLKFKLNQAELLNEIKIKCSRFLDKMKIGCL